VQPTRSSTVKPRRPWRPRTTLPADRPQRSWLTGRRQTSCHSCTHLRADPVPDRGSSLTAVGPSGSSVGAGIGAMLGLVICVNRAGRRGLGVHENGRKETGATGSLRPRSLGSEADSVRNSGARTTTCRAPDVPPSAARTRGDSTAFRPPTGIRCAAQRMSAASAACRSPRRLACGSEAGRARSAAAFGATPPIGRSTASVLASVKGEARQGAPAAPPLTSAVRAGGAVTGRDGRMAVPGPNNRMAGKMRGTVIASACREARAA